MKKNLRSIVFILAMFTIGATLFSSCKKDDEANAEKTLMGEKWVMKSVETNDELAKATYDFALALLTPVYEFKEDGVYEVTFSVLFGEAEPEQGTWSISDDGKELTIDGSTAEIVELTKEVLKIKGTDSMMSDLSDEDTGSTADPVEMTIIFEAK
jgi:hypothetical protein